MNDKTSVPPTADSQTARVFEWRRGFNTIHLIDLGLKLGLFRALTETPNCRAEGLAAKLNLHAPFVTIWCRTAYGMELLDADSDLRYRLAPYFDSILAKPTHPRYLGGYVSLGTGVAAEDFRRCEEAFRTGKAQPFQGRGEEFAKVVGEATQGLQVLTTRKIIPELAGMQARLDAGGRILEVGCGTGNFLLQLCKAFPSAHVVGVDIDSASLRVAGERIKAAHLDARAEVRNGSIAECVASASCDAVVMVEVLHEITQALRPQVLREAARALRPGGWMVIVDETYPSTLEESRRPEFLFPLHTGWEELLWGNIIPTRHEQESLLRAAGLSGPIQREMVGEGFTVLTTQKSV
jgi:SAM-dependent methyltransferase